MFAVGMVPSPGSAVVVAAAQLVSAAVAVAVGVACKRTKRRR